MKKLSKIKLTALSRNEIADREQRLLKGGSGNRGCFATCYEDFCFCKDANDLNQQNSTMYSIVEEFNSADINQNTTYNFLKES